MIENSSLNSLKKFEVKNAKTNDTFKIEEKIKNLLNNFKIYKKIKKSKYVLRIISMTRELNLSFWPGAQIALSKNNSDLELKKIKLVNYLLKKISVEFGQDKRIFLIHIPYNIEVDLNLWKDTFGKQPGDYDQFGAEKKIFEALKDTKIDFIPTLKIMQNENIRSNNALYLKQDGHLSALGNKIISQIVFNNISELYDKYD